MIVPPEAPMSSRGNSSSLEPSYIYTQTIISQPYSSFVSNVNPYNVFMWGGQIELSPESDEWKETDVVEIATYFLDGVMQEFIDKTNGKEAMKRTHKHAKKGRALGLGIMGWHTFLQKKNLPFNCIASTAWTHTIMSKIRSEAEAASRKLAQEYGEPLWCKGTGMRNTHVLAIAPTVSNSRIGGCSAGIEPQPANVYTFNGAKGTFIIKNKELEKLLESKVENKFKNFLNLFLINHCSKF